MSEVQGKAPGQGVSEAAKIQTELVLDAAAGVVKRKDVGFVAGLIVSHTFLLATLDEAQDKSMSDAEFRKRTVEALVHARDHIDKLLDARIA